MRKEFVEHVDKEWIMEKISGHGGSYSYDRPDGIVRIGYIGSTGKLKIHFYNFLLFVRFLKRKIAERHSKKRRKKMSGYRMSFRDEPYMSGFGISYAPENMNYVNRGGNRSRSIKNKRRRKKGARRK